MKKNEGRIFKVLRFLCLSSVIVFGLMTIVGTGSDHGSPKGVFVDSPVEGLRYESLFYIGYTNAEGKFKYKPGHTIVFSVGGIELGSAVASGTLSPVDLVYGAEDETNDQVTNICIFLQTLDEDGNLNNGIRISEAIRDVVEGSMINFDQTPDEFRADPNVISLLADLNAAGAFTDTTKGDRELRTAVQAQSHLSATLGERNTITTTYGKVRGFEDDSDTWCWRGIPFAKPPIDDLVWKAPQDPDSWERTWDATEVCQPCIQYDQSGTSIVGSHDCLYLNVWRPQSEENNLPVYVWIHGGGNSMGHAASDPGTYGANLASKSNMVFVSMNYRLGPYGWLTHPALRTGAPGDEKDDSGNYGTLDIIKALEWIQDNIEAFGGDPDNVLITGESAGAMNVLSLMISPAAEELFHKALAQSGQTFSLPVENGEISAHDVLLKLLINDGLASDNAEAETYLAGMTYTEIEEYLRSKTEEELYAAHIPIGWGMLEFPSIFQDGTVISATGLEMYPGAGHVNKVPIIIGSNKEETKIFLFTDTYFAGKDNLYQVVATYSSDIWKANSVDDVARKLRSYGDQPDVYGYQFLWGAYEAGGGSPIPPPWDFKLGCAHSLDIPFFMGNDTWNSAMTSWVFTNANRPGREALSDAMMDYVARFARTGDPNETGSGLPEWDPWSNNAGEAKCILFDADGDALDISMSTTELTVSGVLATMQSEVSEPLYSQALDYMSSFVMVAHILEN